MKRISLGLALLSVAVGQPVMAASCWNQTVTEAAQVRQFDIMLMVSTIRCFRKGVDFSADYNNFVKTKRAVLRAVGDEMIRHLNGSMGGKAAAVAYDRISVVMANRFGDGVPGYECEDIRAMVVEANAADATRTEILSLAQRAGMEPPLPQPRCDLPAQPTLVASAPVGPLPGTAPVNSSVVAAPLPVVAPVPVQQAAEAPVAAAVAPAAVAGPADPTALATPGAN